MPENEKVFSYRDPSLLVIRQNKFRTVVSEVSSLLNNPIGDVIALKSGLSTMNETGGLKKNVKTQPIGRF